MISQENEKKLVTALINRDEKAIFSFYRANYQSVFRYIYRQIKNYQLAEELTQDSFLELIEALRDFRHQSSLKTFLFAIARNKTIDHIRKKKIKNILFSALPTYVVEGLKIILADEEVQQRELRRKIKKVLQQLPNDYQIILRQKYIEGEKLKAIAKSFKLGFKATESLLFRARQAFIKVFNQL